MLHWELVFVCTDCEAHEVTVAGNNPGSGSFGRSSSIVFKLFKILLLGPWLPIHPTSPPSLTRLKLPR